MSASLKYRPDIDGLRAIAVLAVVLYHFELGPIHGGFVGVDVFFVISGYLITSIIQREISQGTFKFAGFYERRIRRIFPALFVVLLATLLIGTAILLPSDLASLGRGALATLLFVSNILFWRESGYFNTSSEYNPLLHTWSLAVEEQFYIGLPILLLLIHRIAPRLIKPILVGCVLGSFALCALMQTGHPSATFFLSPTRAWELLLGSLLAVGILPKLTSRVWREVIAVLALLVLLGSLILTVAGPSFPGVWAAPPVLATAALLYLGGEGDSVVRRSLEWRPLTLVGLISYSLYLWHWPLLTFARYRNGMEPIPQIEAWVLVMVSLAAAAASYRYVETPFRKRSGGEVRPKARQRLFAGSAAAAVLLGCMSVAVTMDGGWEARFAPETLAYDRARSPFIPFKDECDGRRPGDGDLRCVIGDRDSSRVALVWGDSYALAWAPGLDSMLKARGLRGVLAVNSACPPLLGIHNPSDPKCYFDNKATHEWLHDHQPEMTLMVAAWSGYSSPEGRFSIFDDEGREGNVSTFPPALQRTLAELSSLSRTVIVVGPTPGAPKDVPFQMAVAGGLRPSEVTQSAFQRDAQWFWRVARKFPSRGKVVLIDPADWFCDGRACRYVDDKGQLLYRDGGHLSILGAEFATRRLSSQLESASPGPSNAALL